MEVSEFDECPSAAGTSLSSAAQTKRGVALPRKNHRITRKEIRKVKHPYFYQDCEQENMTSNLANYSNDNTNEKSQTFLTATAVANVDCLQ